MTPKVDESFSGLAETCLTAVGKISAMDLTSVPGGEWLISR